MNKESKEVMAEMGIGIVDNNVVHMKFGKGKIGITVGGNSESENPVVLLVPIKKKSVSEPFTPDDMKKGRMSVALEFENAESIDVLILNLQAAKKQILTAVFEKQREEIAQTVEKLEKTKGKIKDTLADVKKNVKK
jgi:hypothetical protein